MNLRDFQGFVRGKSRADLEGSMARYAGIVFGNGPSRLAHSIERYADCGAILAVCNRYGATTTPAHVWCFLDGEVATEVGKASWLPYVRQCGAIFTDFDNHHRLRAIDKVQYWARRQRPGMEPPYEQYCMSSCGNFAFQILHYLGCNPILLAGFDGTKGNVYPDALERQPDVPYRGKVSKKRLVEWTEELETMVRHCSEGEDARVIRKLGDAGVLQVPSYTGESLEWLFEEVRERHLEK